MEDTPKTFLDNTRRRLIVLIDDEIPNEENFCYTLLAASNCCGIVQKDLAKVLGVSPVTIQRWTKVDSQPSNGIIRKAYLQALKQYLEGLLSPAS